MTRLILKLNEKGYKTRYISNNNFIKVLEISDKTKILSTVKQTPNKTTVSFIYDCPKQAENEIENIYKEVFSYT